MTPVLSQDLSPAPAPGPTREGADQRLAQDALGAIDRRSRLPLPHIVAQHAEEAVRLRALRSVLVRAPQVRLPDLLRQDERLAAHLDGLAVAGELGTRQCLSASAVPGVGEVFCAAVRALEDRDSEGLAQLIVLADRRPSVEPGLTSAFGWVPGRQLHGIVADLLSAAEPARQSLGITACALHRVDPGARLGAACRAAEPRLRARALRAAGELGRRELLDSCLSAFTDPDPGVRLHAACAALLLGERHRAPAALEAYANTAAPGADEAARLLLRASELPRALRFLRNLQGDPQRRRLLVIGTGLIGDPRALPWLIERMSEGALARLAGAAFTLITGADLVEQGLAGERPDGVRAGPTDDPDDPNVGLDPDAGLPWPDPGQTAAWWQAHRARFSEDTRHFMGQPLAPAVCERVLRTGCQPDRTLAALDLCLLEPGQPRFPTAAPAHRQCALLDGRPPPAP